MITGCLNLNPAGRATGRMWRSSRDVVAEGFAGKGRGESPSQCVQMDSIQRERRPLVGERAVRAREPMLSMPL